MNEIAELPNKKTLVQQKNHLLASMTESEWRRVEPYFEYVDFSLNQVLYESGKTPAYMYFPTTAIVSLLYIVENGASTEVAVIGNEGVVGMSLFFSGSYSPNTALVQTAGKGYRMRAQTAKNLICRSDVMLNVLLHYSQTMINQVAQNALCIRHHVINQQLCRRLLSALDRLPTNQIATTHEMLANLLGVRRESITEAALNLQSAGIISYGRGLITVLNRKALELLCCECYAITKREQPSMEKMPLHA